MKHDWISIIVIGVMISCVVVAIIFYYNDQHRECTGNPLLYAAKYYEDRYGVEVIGTLSFLHPNSPIIHFDSKGVNIEYKERYNSIMGFNQEQLDEIMNASINQ